MFFYARATRLSAYPTTLEFVMRIVIGLVLVVLSSTSALTQITAKGDRREAGSLVLAKVTGLAPESGTAVGGSSIRAVVTISGRVPSALRVNLASSNQAVATVPGSVEVSRGSTAAAFQIETRGVSTATPVTIEASYGGSTARANVTVEPARLHSVKLLGLGLSHSDEDYAYGGNSLRVSVWLDGSAPPDGAVVLLSNSHPSIAVIPGFVKVPEGAKSVSVDGELASVAAVTPISVTASYAELSRLRELNVLPPYAWAIHLAQTSVLGGSPVAGEIILGGAAPSEGWEVGLLAAPPVEVPPRVMVPAGSRKVSFVATTKPVAAKVNARIAPTSAEYAEQIHASLTVEPPALQDLVIEPSSASYQSDSVEGRVSLTGPAPAGLSVPLSWTSTEAATAPDRVAFEEGATTATFRIGLKPVTVPTQFTLSAFFGTRKTTTLTVNP
jgi:hypothetical protein